MSFYKCLHIFVYIFLTLLASPFYYSFHLYNVRMLENPLNANCYNMYKICECIGIYIINYLSFDFLKDLSEIVKKNL